MFGLAYVILPFTDTSPAEAIAASLARFRRGRRGDVPDEWLRFHDETAHIREMHEARYTFTRDKGLRISGGDSWYLDSSAVLAEMERRGKVKWTVCFAQIEPDLGRFAERFLRPFERHPVTNGFGRWLNALGEWDWWDLGGCFDGAITGAPRHGVRSRAAISSGPSLGRAAFETLANALEEACGQEPNPEIDVPNDNNIEMVATLGDELDAAKGPRVPHTIVLPPGSTDDEKRWLSSWPELASTGPSEAWERNWRATARAAYHRHSDHWAAAVAYHF
ncbi:MAG: hypothetical protein QOJ94_614 [Sphingomonadales bacterium]|nr:hypothetical protein [Sphingomonadales bacterium]